MMILNISGHIAIICIGIPVIVGVVYNLRSIRLQKLLFYNSNRIKSDTDALIQINSIEHIIKETHFKQKDNISLIGIINLHVFECQKINCLCKSESELFDPSTGEFVKRGKLLHKDLMFLKYFVKQLYEEALNKFTNSTQLNIAYSYYLFTAMKNLHASLLELSIAEKKKLSFIQEFMVYRRKIMMEISIQADSKESKTGYDQLTNVTEYEELLINLKKGIEKVASFQAEFWAQVGNQLPDLNILRSLSDQIYDSTKETEQYWNRMCQINSDCQKALTIYSNYMLEIKHHNQISHELLDRY